jgi:hypothetical protein
MAWFSLIVFLLKSLQIRLIDLFTAQALGYMLFLAHQPCVEGVTEAALMVASAFSSRPFHPLFFKFFNLP